MKASDSLALALCASLLVTSCSSYSTYSKPPDKDLFGLYYYLPRGYITVSGGYVKKKVDSGTESSFVVAVAQVRVSDDRALMFAHLSENVMYDEDSAISTKDGLLTTATAKPEDKTADIIKTIVQTGLNVAATFDKAVSATPNEYIEFDDVKFDPFDEKERDAAVEKLKGYGLNMTFSNSKAATSLHLDDDKAHSGLAYRRPYPITVFLAPNGKRKVPDGTKMVYDQRSSMVLPDPSTVAYVPLRRGFMTKRETSVDFVNGEPIKLGLKAPSPVLGFVKLPADVVKMVGDALPALVKVQPAAKTP